MQYRNKSRQLNQLSVDRHFVSYRTARAQHIASEIDRDAHRGRNSAARRARARVNGRIIVSDTTVSGATYAIDGLLLETENDNQPLRIFAIFYSQVTFLFLKRCPLRLDCLTRFITSVENVRDLGDRLLSNKKVSKRNLA